MAYVASMNPQARLRDWLSRSGMSVTDLSKLLEMSQPHTSHVLNGGRTPSLVMAARIQRVTGIPAADWVEPPAEPDDVTGVPV